MGLNETVKACGLVSNNWICLERDRETPVVRTGARVREAMRMYISAVFVCLAPADRSFSCSLSLSTPYVTLFSLDC